MNGIAKHRNQMKSPRVDSGDKSATTLECKRIACLLETADV